MPEKLLALVGLPSLGAKISSLKTISVSPCIMQLDDASCCGQRFEEINIIFGVVYHIYIYVLLVEKKH